jgi:hypothetical protein
MKRIFPQNARWEDGGDRVSPCAEAVTGARPSFLLRSVGESEGRWIGVQQPSFHLDREKGKREKYEIPGFHCAGSYSGPSGLRCLHLQGGRSSPESSQQEVSSIATLRMEEELLVPIHQTTRCHHTKCGNKRLFKFNDAVQVADVTRRGKGRGQIA